jgi:hypothetical protein
MYHRWHRTLVPTVFALGVCLLISSPFLVSARHRPTIPETFPVSNAPDRAPFSFHVPSLEPSPAVAERKVRCRVHGAEIKSILVRVEYGLRIGDDRLVAYLTAEEASFPHCDDAIWGGCMGGPDEDFKEVCQECNAARDKWLHEHLPNLPR